MLRYYTDHNPGSACMSLNRLDVAPEHQRKGYGTLLMNNFLDKCLEHCSDINIWVDPKRSEQDDPLVFYRKSLKKHGISL